MKLFKYKSVHSPRLVTESKLNTLGRQGWELCAIIPDDFGYTYFIKKEIENGETNL